jgi:alpha-D-ribose 1-methylphosphonate 5-triphosphate synthase subunit PhnH
MPDFADTVGPVTGGFVDPVYGAQQAFRQVLDAMARPGLIHEVPAALLREPPPCDVATASLLLTLADFETPVWLGPSLAGLEGFVRFHCGSPFVAPAASLFAVARPQDLPALGTFQIGASEYPDRSTTLIVQVSDVRRDGPLVLRGPGIESEHRVSIDGLAESFWLERDALEPLFPLGIDLILTAGERVVCIPRTTRVERR